MKKSNGFYVYVLYRPNGTPAYVGKGTGGRVKVHAKMGKDHKNPILAATFQKYGDLSHEIVFRTDDEKEALNEEMRLIALYGRKNNSTGILCNLTDGGEGNSGVIWSEEARRKSSLATQKRFKENPESHPMLGRKHSAESIDKMRQKLTGRKLSEEHRKKISIASSNKSNETKEKIRQSAIGRKLTDQEKEKISIANKGRKRSDEAKEKMRKAAHSRPYPTTLFDPEMVAVYRARAWETRKKMYASGEKNHPMLGRKQSEETRRKISETKRLRAAEKLNLSAESK